MSKFLLKVIITIGVAAIFFGCSEDESSVETIPSDHPIIGTWVWTEDIYSGCDDPELNRSIAVECTSGICVKRTFTSDNKVKYETTFEGEILESSGTFKISGNKLEMVTVEDNTTHRSTAIFEITGETMTLDLGENELNGCTNIGRYSKEQ